MKQQGFDLSMMAMGMTVRMMQQKHMWILVDAEDEDEQGKVLVADQQNHDLRHVMV